MSRVAIDVPAAGVGAGEIEDEVRRHARTGAAIRFVGAEPTERPELPDWIALARAEGAPAVGIATHGRALADRELVRALVRAGLTDASLAIFGARAEVHDHHAGAAGAFAATVAGLSRLRTLGLEVVVDTLVTRSNYRVLAELVPRLVAWDVRGWCVRWPHAVADADQVDPIVPRLGMAAPFVLHVIATATQRGLSAFTSGLPTCVLGPLASTALPARARAFTDDDAACGGCPARPSCPGVDAGYLARFGATELHPVEPDGPAGRHDPGLAELFAGGAPPPRTPQTAS